MHQVVGCVYVYLCAHVRLGSILWHIPFESTLLVKMSFALILGFYFSIYGSLHSFDSNIRPLLLFTCFRSTSGWQLRGGSVLV